MTIGIRLLTALLILGSPFILRQRVQRRTGLMPTWFISGVMLFMGAFIGRTLLFFLFPAILLNNPLFGGIIIGLVVAVTDTVARVVGYQTIAKEAVYREHAYLIGLGYALLPLLSTGIGLLLDGASHVYQGTSNKIDMGVSVAELIIAWGNLFWYLTLSWLVLQTFIRGQIGWIFGAMLWSGVVAGTQAFILNGSLHPVTINSIWWFSVAMVSIAIAYFVQAPPEFQLSGGLGYQGEFINDEQVHD